MVWGLIAYTGGRDRDWGSVRECRAVVHPLIPSTDTRLRSEFSPRRLLSHGIVSVEGLILIVAIDAEDVEPLVCLVW